MIAEHDQGKKDSPMGCWLLDKLHKRKISTPDFVEGCQAELQSNASSSHDPIIPKVARLKSKGSNTSRDVNNILSKDCQLLECYEADIPLWDSSSGTQIISKMRFLNIHEVMDDIVRQHPEVDASEFIFVEPEPEFWIVDAPENIEIVRVPARFFQLREFPPGFFL